MHEGVLASLETFKFYCKFVTPHLPRAIHPYLFDQESPFSLKFTRAHRVHGFPDGLDATCSRMSANPSCVRSHEVILRHAQGDRCDAEDQTRRAVFISQPSRRAGITRTISGIPCSWSSQKRPGMGILSRAEPCCTPPGSLYSGYITVAQSGLCTATEIAATFETHCHIYAGTLRKVGPDNGS